MLKKVLFSFQANFIVAVLTLLITLITAKYLGAAGRGYLSIIITYLALIQLFTGVFGPGTVFYVLRNYLVGEICLVSYLWSLIMTLIGTILLNKINLINADLTVVFFLNAVFWSFFSLNVRVMINKTRLLWYNACIILQPLILLISLAILGFNNFTIKDFLIYQSISYFFLTLITLCFLCKELLKGIRVEKLKNLFTEFFRIGVLNQLSAGTQLVNYRFSFFFLEKFSGLRAVGIFSIILSLANVIWLFSVTAGTLIGNEVSKSIGKSDLKTLNQTDKYLKLSFTVSVLIIVIAFIFPSSFYLTLLSKDFIGVKYFLMLMAPAILVFSISKVLAFYFSSIGKTNITFYSSLMGLAPTILGYWLVKSYNLYGVVLSTSMSFLISTLILLYFYNKDKKASTL